MVVALSWDFWSSGAWLSSCFDALQDFIVWLGLISAKQQQQQQILQDLRGTLRLADTSFLKVYISFQDAPFVH